LKTVGLTGDALLESHPEVLPSDAPAVLLQKSGGGNPLFVRNIATTLKEELVSNKGAPRRLQDLPAGFFHDLIVSRFDALERMEQTALKAASVIGTTFSMRLLLHMLPPTSRDKRGDLHSALLKLIEANFISRTVVGKTERFNFVHASVQETIYKMMLTDQRQHLHEICAAWYEQHFRNSMTYVSLITHHWLRSACAPKKVHYLQRAAHHAKETFSNEEAIQHLSALVALAFGKDTATAQLVSLRRYWDTGVHVVPAAAAATAAAASPQHQQQHGGSVLAGSATVAPELTAATANASVARSGSTAAVVPVTAAVCDSTSGTATATPTPTSAATAGTAGGAMSPTAGSSAVTAPLLLQPSKLQQQQQQQQKQQQQQQESDSSTAGCAAIVTRQWQRLLSLAVTPFAGACSAATADMHTLSDPNSSLAQHLHSSSTTASTSSTSFTAAGASGAVDLRSAARSDIRLDGQVAPLANLTPRERRLLAARDRCWLFAHDLTTCTEFSDAALFDAPMVGRWIGEIGLAYHQLGRLLPAHNHMQVTHATNTPVTHSKHVSLTYAVVAPVVMISCASVCASCSACGVKTGVVVVFTHGYAQ
jgi:hypothetical protein